VNYTTSEMMAVAAARALTNEDVCFVGIGAPSLACNLARLTHAPGITLIYESGTIDTRPNVLPLSIGDGELAETARSVIPLPEIFTHYLQRGRVDVGFLGAAQVDRVGGLNSTVIGRYAAPQVRLPGAGGAPEIAAHARQCFVVLRAAPRSCVARLDFRTSAGYLDGPGARARAGARGAGPRAVITDFGLLRPHPASCDLQLAALFPGASVEQARAAVLDFFNADPAEYLVILTPNCSGALRLVGKSYPFEPGGRLLMTADNHNSVNGIREFAWARGAEVTYLPVVAPEMRVDESQLLALLDRAAPGRRRLLAYPAQSNFTGAQHPLEWIAAAQSRGWDVLLDAAAFVPTNRLDLGRWRPDFVSLSFYKMFGYPTGVGALLARRSALARLRRPWFAGGTISIVSVQGRGWHYLLPGEAGFEDGTVNYLSLPAVEIGLRHLNAIGIDVIHERVMCLTGWLLERMQGLRHANGAPLARIYGPGDARGRGGNIAFNLFDRYGKPYDYHHVEALAAQGGISLRTGCFCNPGDGEVAHDLRREEMAACFRGGPMAFSEFFTLIHAQTGKTPSTMRVSLGLASNFADVYTFVNSLETFRDRRAADLPWAPEPTLAAVRERDAA